MATDHNSIGGTRQLNGTVSVIIPTHNRRDLLRAAIDSVLAQTYPEIEIIVVDDGSTDDTTEAMAQYIGRIVYLRQSNQGVAATRNAGIRAATGEYLTFLDDDDLMLPTKIERQVQLLAARPEAGLVHCRFYHVDRDGNVLDKVGVLPQGQVLKPLLCGNFMWAGAPLVRRQCLDQVGMFDEHIPATCADWDMWLRIAQAGYPFACVQEPLGSYRVQQDSMLAKVGELESAVLAVLHKVYANPYCPVDALAVKAQAYGSWLFWISCRYHAARRWDDAQRNLAKTLDVYPEILENRAEFLDTLCSEAFDVRVDDPFSFIDGFLDHLPPTARPAIQPWRSCLISRVHAGLALRNYARDEIAAARTQLAAAVAAYPPMLEREDDFARMLSTYAMSLPGAPRPYVAKVFHSLPPEARRLRHWRSRVLSDVNIGCAFEDYFADRRRLAARRILSALCQRPSWIRNRGVVSVLMKSLPKLVIGEQAAA